MQDVLENTGNTASVPQRPGLMSTIFREYRNHFGLFWRVMLPLFVALFFGTQVQITLQHTPVWAIAVMTVVSTLIDALLAPIWALLTTHLYMERAGTQQNAVSH